MYKISVICPVYNSEKYLENTIKSIINQSIGFKNIELILVDDNSNDKSKDIMKRYSNEYSNIKSIFLNENHGFPGFGRNVGIKNATADYIMFIDNDDEYEEHLCENLFKTITEYECDIVGCNILNIDLNSNYKRIRDSMNTPTEKITTFSYPEIIYYEDVYIWNKIFKKEIILKNNMKFITEGLNEDTLFCREYFINSSKLCHINNYNGYIYFAHAENLSTPTLTLNYDILNSYYKSLNLFKKYNLKVDNNKIFYGTIYGTYERLILMENEDLDTLNKFLKEFQEFQEKIKFNNNYLNNPFFRFLNSLLLKKHTYFVSILIKIFSSLSKNKLLKGIYRKAFH